MGALLAFLTALAVRLAVLLGAAWLACGLLSFHLRWRGSVWHLNRAGRRRRLWEARLVALLLAALIGFAAGWLVAWPDTSGLPAVLEEIIGGLPTSAGTVLGVLVTGAALLWSVRELGARVRLGEALIDGAEAPVAPMPPRAPPTAGRRIVILCDGTGNRPPDAEDPAASNIWKIRQALVEDETQTIWYDPGVGTGTSRAARLLAGIEGWSKRLGLSQVNWLAALGRRLRMALEGMTGTGIGENILQGYQEVVRQYRPGDRIVILGFSRGAYTARCIAGVIARCGVLKAGYLRYVPAALDLYRARRGQAERVAINPEFLHLLPDPEQPDEARGQHPHVPIEMLGVFDTVASLGAPLWGWWFTVRGFRNLSLSTNPVPNCRHVYHALAMDERRATFFPTLFWRPPGAARGWNETLLQLWFRGAHADVGGGYAETGISDITLGWMLGHAQRHGLAVKPEALAALRPDPLARLHDETARQPSWLLMGTWPRWARLDAGAPSGNSGIGVHDSVFTRAAAVAAGAGRLDLHDLAPGEAVNFVTEAHRQWDRTGLVIHGGDAPDAWYRLTWLGGVWRDQDCSPCGPAGEPAAEQRVDSRWFWRWRRRLPAVPWMTLCATIAGPQRWRLRELPLRVALRYLFFRDPERLRWQVAPLGACLGSPGDSLLLRSEHSAGMLYLFANDLWQTVGNNSGALELRLERLPGDPGGPEPLWLLPERGPWRCYDKGGRPG